MRRSSSQFAWYILLLIALASGIYDGSFHFDAERIELKRAARSPQRHWNLFYNQSYVFNDASLQYQVDIDAIRPLLEPDSVLLADLATSYYVAAQLPVFLPNVHRHHKRQLLGEWRKLLDSGALCRLDDPRQVDRLRRFIESDLGDIVELGAEFRYLLVNKDQVNLNMRNDCLSQTRTSFVNNIQSLAQVIYDGEFLRLYQINQNGL